MAGLIRQTARSHKYLILGNIAFALLLGIAEASLFAVLYRFIRVLSGAPLPPALAGLGLSRSQAYLALLIVILMLQLIASVSRGMNNVLSGKFAARCQAQIIPTIHRFILSLSFNCASSFRIGDLAHRAALGAHAINAEIEHGSQILSDALLCGVYLLVLLLISPWLMILAFLLAIGIAVSQSWLRPRIREASMEVETQQRQIASAIMADLQVLRLLHSSAATENSSHRFEQHLQGMEKKQRRLNRLRSLLEPIAEMMPMLAAVILGGVSWKLSNGQPTVLIPGLATFVLALQRLNLKLIRLGQQINMMTENQARVALINDLLRTDNKIFRRTGGTRFGGLTQQIRFEGVSLCYPERERFAIIDLDFTLPRNSTVAVVGSSGAGKSSIADLLVGLINPTQGRILIDGVDLQCLDLDSWQRHLGVVTQDVLLRHDTILANIAFGMEGAISEQAVQQAAVAACADGFIRQLPAGYHTVIGEHGHRLSGGQRQRLSLARAILRQPEILILDEATSALDSHSEVLVHQSIKAFSSGRTVLAIAHRLSSIRDAALILVMEAGQIVERGTHAQLLAQAGRYAALWQYQQQRATSARDKP